MGNDFGSYELISMTICRTQCVQQTVFDHLSYTSNESFGKITKVKPLDIVMSNDRSLTCTTTQDSEICPVCRETLNYGFNFVRE